MNNVLTELCEYLNNYFWTKKIQGNYSIQNGSINVAGIQDGQYFRIVGSVFNDGVHQYPITSLTDEDFEGTVWLMAVPQTVIDLASDIDAWQTKYGNSANSPWESESFGNYSRSKGTVSGNESNPNTWQAAFATRLNKWRRLRGL